MELFRQIGLDPARTIDFAWLVADDKASFACVKAETAGSNLAAP